MQGQLELPSEVSQRHEMHVIDTNTGMEQYNTHDKPSETWPTGRTWRLLDSTFIYLPRMRSEDDDGCPSNVELFKEKKFPFIFLP